MIIFSPTLHPMKKIIYFCGALLTVLTSCKPDDGGGEPPAPSPRKAVIGIQGQSINGISTVAEYDITNQTLDNNLYRKRNLQPIGSSMQDILIDEDTRLIYFVVPGSSEIVVANMDTYELIRNIRDVQGEGLRRMVKVGDYKYYVSSFDEDGVYVLKGQRNNVRDVIETGTDPEAMLVHENYVFVANTGGYGFDSTVTIINSLVDTVVTTLQVGIDPNSMVIDAENRLWIMCSGRFNTQNPLLSGIGSLYRYHLDSLKMAIDSNATIPLDTVFYFTDNQIRPTDLVIDQQGQKLYYLGGAPVGDLFSMNTYAPRVSETPAVTGDFYALSFDEEASDLYALQTGGFDYNENGRVIIYNPDMNEKNRFIIGVKPFKVAFK